MRNTTSIAALLVALVISPSTGARAQQIQLDDCTSFDDAVLTNRAAFAQQQLSDARAINTTFPMVPAYNACVQQILDQMAKSPKSADILGLVAGYFASNAAGSACQAAMGSITSAQNTATSYAKACLPLPDFGAHGLEAATFPTYACGGKTPYSMSLTTGVRSTPPQAYQQYLGQ